MDPRLAPSIAAQSLGSAANALISLGLMLFLARHLGAVQFGDYVALLSVAVMLLIAIEGGWPTLVYRESVMPGAKALAQSQALVRSALGHVVVSGLGLVLVAVVLRAPGLAAALACMTLTALMNLISAQLRGAGRFLQEARWQILGRTVSALAILAAVLTLGASPAIVFLAWAAGLSIAVLVAGRPWLLRPDWSNLRANYALALPFVMLEGVNAFLFKGDVALLRWLELPAVELSQYAACTRLTEAGLLLFAPITNVMQRALRQRAADVATFNSLARLAVLFAAAAGVVALLGSAWWGTLVMPALFGDEFIAAGVILPWVALMLVFGLPNLVCAQALIARGRERWLLAACSGAALVQVLGLALGSEWNGARGAAQGVAASQALLLAALLVQLRRRTET